MAVPPNPPRNVVASNIRTTSVKIDWQFPLFNGGAEHDDFRVRRWVGPTATGKFADNSTHNNDTFRTISDLDVGQTYTFKVYGHNSAGWSDPSDPITVTLLGGAWIRAGGQWKQAICYVRSSGKWKEATPYIRDAGTWKQSRR
jgi:hypothetical protein